MSRARLLLAFATVGLAAVACAAGPVAESQHRNEGARTIEIDGMSVEVALGQAQLRRAQDLQLHVGFTNLTTAPLRMNARFLAFPTIVMKVRTANGEPVNPGPPPMPPRDDGQAGRRLLEPRESARFVYKGDQWFAVPLAPGRYQVRFVYAQAANPHGDWVGRVESDWLDFSVLP